MPYSPATTPELASRLAEDSTKRISGEIIQYSCGHAHFYGAANKRFNDALQDEVDQAYLDGRFHESPAPCATCGTCWKLNRNQ